MGRGIAGPGEQSGAVAGDLQILRPLGLSLRSIQNDIRNVWSAACLQAKSDDDSLVCANVFGF